MMIGDDDDLEQGMNAGHETSQDNDVPIEIAFQVDNLCNQFEQACRHGEAPDPRDYVRRVDARGADQLLEELVAIRCELTGQTSPHDDRMKASENSRHRFATAAWSRCRI